MNVTIRAASKAAKPFLWLWLIAAALLVGYLAIETNGFTKRPWTPWAYISPRTLPLGDQQ